MVPRYVRGVTGNWAWFHDSWEIVGALGSAAAAIVAVLLASKAREDRQLAEQERDAARAAQRRAELAQLRREREAQARQVAVWLDTDEPVVWEAPDLELPYRPPNLIMHIVNHSGLPIFDIAPGELGDEGASSIGVSHAVLQPGGVIDFQVPRDFVERDEPETPPPLLWFFRDLAGVVWTRDASGALRDDLVVQLVEPPESPASRPSADHSTP